MRRSMHPGVAARGGLRKPGASSRHGCEEEKEKGRNEERTEHKEGEFELDQWKEWKRATNRRGSETLPDPLHLRTPLGSQ